ncbi:MAG: peptide chain release factor N(5)-glutamine methyltransferase [Synergistaceae bacterium]|nr:peptide chain release factor N(5)-glutamine methyltransferase [Synergistaceae bacterium]
MTSLSGARKWAAARLREMGIESPAAEAELMLLHATGLSRPALAARGREPAGDRAFENLKEIVERRRAGEPLQYILGGWEFYGCTLKVRPGVLIPRQDTEVLVEIALPLIPEGGRFLDWGTGTGCLPLALLSERRDITAIAADANPLAVALAWHNLSSAGVLHRCLLWHSREPGDIPVEDGELSVLVSNPPYIPSQDLPGLMKEVRAEPVSALDGGEDGLAWYRKLFEWGPAKVRPGGWVLFEIGDGRQGERLAEISPENLEFRGVFQDLSGKPRAALWHRV